MATAEKLLLKSEEQEVARAELDAVLAVARNERYRKELGLALAAIDAGALKPDHAETVERVLGLALESGRIRALYGPGGEQAALRLYRRLPAGVAVQASAEEVGEALTSLRGKTIESIAVKPVGPGAFTVALAADGIQLSVRLDRQGARLTSVEV